MRLKDDKVNKDEKKNLIKKKEIDLKGKQIKRAKQNVKAVCARAMRSGIPDVKAEPITLEEL